MYVCFLGLIRLFGGVLAAKSALLVLMPEDEWTLIDDSSERVLLQGKDDIMSRTGRIDFNEEYNTDIFKYVEDCDEEEIELLRRAIESNSIDAMDLTSDDIEYINQWG